MQDAPPFVGSELSDSAFTTIREVLLDKLGFDLALYKDRIMKRRVATRVRALGFREATPYLERLRRDDGEVDALMTALTIHVSEFFRDLSTFAALETDILPRLLESEREIRLWSVGCAGGEEPYSLALLLDELSPEGARISILGTDISLPILIKAREGLFDPMRLEEVPPPIMARYFTPEGKRYRLHERIRAMVRFEKHNILTDSGYPSADLILCRNLLIYFSRQEQEKILSRLAASLSPGGFLVLGRAETLIGEARQAFAVESPAERIYRRLP